MIVEGSWFMVSRGGDIGWGVSQQLKEEERATARMPKIFRCTLGAHVHPFVSKQLKEEEGGTLSVQGLG